MKKPWFRDFDTGLEEGRVGRFAVLNFTVDDQAASFGALRAAASGDRRAYVAAGEYQGLVEIHDGRTSGEQPQPERQADGLPVERHEVWMSTTRDELRDHVEVVRQARRMVESRNEQVEANAAQGHRAQVAPLRALVTGLGLGCIVTQLLREGFHHVDVVEKEADVLALVGRQLLRTWGEERLTFHHADVLELPITYWDYGAQWDVVWHDIWPDITADNLPEMARLNRRYARRARWYGAWCQAECRRHAAQVKRELAGMGF